MRSTVLGISSSIAAYKSIDLARALYADPYDIKIVLSSAAAKFVSPLILRTFFPKKSLSL